MCFENSFVHRSNIVKASTDAFILSSDVLLSITCARVVSVNDPREGSASRTSR